MASINRNISDMLSKSGLASGIGDTTTRSDESDAARANGLHTRHDIASETRIHDQGTLDRYKSTWREFFSYARENGYGNKPSRYPASLVKDYLDAKIHSGASLNTINSCGSALNKLDDCLNNAYGVRLDYSSVIADARAVAREVSPRLDVETRAFSNPRAVIAAIGNEDYRLAATVQLETGLRSMNALDMRLNQDGSAFVVSKAGYTVRHFQLPSALYSQLSARADASGRVHLGDYKGYIAAIRDACAAVGEKYSGSHAFRHNFARNMYDELRASGVGEYAAKMEVAEALFHGRIDVVERYLR